MPAIYNWTLSVQFHFLRTAFNGVKAIAPIAIIIHGQNAACADSYQTNGVRLLRVLIYLRNLHGIHGCKGISNWRYFPSRT